MDKNHINSNDYIQEDEIDLRELFNTIAKQRYKVFIFVFIMTLLSLMYVLSIPNSYKSKTILSSESSNAKSISGNMAALASFANINLGSDNNNDPFILMEQLKNDYSFNLLIVKKYKLDEKLITKKENLVFAMGIDTIYNMLHSTKKDDSNNKEDEYFERVKELRDILSIEKDKQTGLITLSAIHNDRYLAKELVDIYLKEITHQISEMDLINLDKKIESYKSEIANTYDVYIKEQLSQLISSLMQKKVFSKVNEFYLVRQIIKSEVSYIKDKTKPKRALIIIVSIITSFILAIFLVFFTEFIKSNKDINEKDN